MTTIPEKYARIILTAVKMGDTGSVPLEQLVAENIERAIEEATKELYDAKTMYIAHTMTIELPEDDFCEWLKEIKQNQTNTANASYPTQPE